MPMGGSSARTALPIRGSRREGSAGGVVAILILRNERSECLEGWRQAPRVRPSFETRPISAFTRVFDALWDAPQDEGLRKLLSHGLRLATLLLLGFFSYCVFTSLQHGPLIFAPFCSLRGIYLGDSARWSRMRCSRSGLINRIPGASGPRSTGTETTRAPEPG
jgi:hypothetical protein